MEKQYIAVIRLKHTRMMEESRMENVNGKVFLITGAAGGIGSGVARSVLEKGAEHVAILDINVKDGQAFEAELNAKYGANKAKFIKCDVTTSDLDVAYEETIKNHEYIDVVVNAAGIINESADMFRKGIEINVTALIASSLKAYSMMRKDRSGRGGTIVNISSMASLMHVPILPVYSATKSAVLKFSTSLGHKGNYNRSGVRVITICFGLTNTNLLSVRKCCIDEESDALWEEVLRNWPTQSIELASQGFITAFEKGASGSTWKVCVDKPAEDITDTMNETFRMLSGGPLFD